ncbi:MAG: hypothetical protein WC505_06245 [Patescibacteria group bacterium]
MAKQPNALSADETAEIAKIAREGFNSWLASLPLDDWGDSYEHAQRVHWDEATGEWVEDDRPV